ncbi:(d)CMP kinase [Aedoeadaptatus coxii]|uniref:(d)CMP kinase n=1 Tax=Aedoeadaptatus coxii TaxID=755172 RepID=UPI002AD4A6CF|nr:(d)CMP kinase [Peptoniphilus coxii]
MSLKIAIDGPSGAGKSAIAKALAKRLDYEYIDTGSLYRTIAYIATEIAKTDDVDEILKACDKVRIGYENGAVTLDCSPLGDVIRTEAISQKTSELSKNPNVRQYLLQLQRRLAENGGTVMEGRDIGTVILPDAEIKFFLTASEEERARRRYLQRKELGETVDLKTIQADLHKRDLRDRTREIAPLKQAEDAVVIDSTNLGEDEVIEKMLHYVEKANVL